MEQSKKFRSQNLLKTCVLHWHSLSLDWKSLYKQRHILPVAHWGLGVLKNSFESWKQFVREKQRFDDRIEQAQIWRHETLRKDALCHWNRIGEMISFERQAKSDLLQRQLYLAAKYGAKWRKLALFAPKTERIKRQSKLQDVLGFNQDFTFKQRGRPAPRKPDFVFDAETSMFMRQSVQRVLPNAKEISIDFGSLSMVDEFPSKHTPNPSVHNHVMDQSLDSVCLMEDFSFQCASSPKSSILNGNTPQSQECHQAAPNVSCESTESCNVDISNRIQEITTQILEYNQIYKSYILNKQSLEEVNQHLTDYVNSETSYQMNINLSALLQKRSILQKLVNDQKKNNIEMKEKVQDLKVQISILMKNI